MLKIKRKLISDKKSIDTSRLTMSTKKHSNLQKKKKCNNKSIYCHLVTSKNPLMYFIIPTSMEGGTAISRYMTL